MTTPTAEIERRLVALLDGIDEPVSIATAIRDRDGRILDFRLEFVNQRRRHGRACPASR